MTAKSGSLEPTLDEKRVIVSGGTSGIGHACVSKLLQLGACVVSVDKTKPKTDAKPNLLFADGDVTQRSTWKNAIKIAVKAWGGIDGLVNAAGVYVASDDIDNLDLEVWQRVLDVNMKASYLSCQEVLPTLSKAGGGSIVNIASVSGQTGFGGLLAYSASKGGLRLLSRSAALHCAQSGMRIRVNVVNPGYVDTAMFRAGLEEAEDKDVEYSNIVALHPLGRIGKPVEVANVVAFLLSDESMFVTGAEFACDGGFSAI